MSVNLRYPNISGFTEKEQLAQIKSYLYQLVDQLNYALPSLGGSTQTYEVQGTEVSYYELRSLIISTTGELRDQYEKLYQRLETDYTSKKDFNENAEAVSAELDRLLELINTLDGLVENLKGEDVTIKESIADLSGSVTSLSKSVGDLAAEDVAIKKTIDDLAAEDVAVKKSITDLSGVVNALKNTLDSLSTKVDGIDKRIQSIIDFVKEAGTSGGWTYKKWNGGTCELFGTFTRTTTSDPAAVGSMFCSEEFLIATPFVINNAVVTGSADGMFSIVNAGTDGGNNIRFVLLRPDSFDVGTNAVVKLHVVGTFNPGGIE